MPPPPAGTPTLALPQPEPFFRRNWLLRLLRPLVSFTYLILGMLLLLSALGGGIVAVSCYLALALEATAAKGVAFVASLVGSAAGIKALLACAREMDRLVQKYDVNPRSLATFLALTLLSFACTLGSGLWIWRSW